MDPVFKAYAETFTTGWGLQVLEDLKDGFHYNRPMFGLGGAAEGLELAFREGQRSVILEILRCIEVGLSGEEALPNHYREGDQLDG